MPNDKFRPSWEERAKNQALIKDVLEYGRRTDQLPGGVDPRYVRPELLKRILEIQQKYNPPMPEPTAQDQYADEIERYAQAEGISFEEAERKFRIREEESDDDGGPWGMAKGFLGRTFDVLSRGQYMMAEGVQQALNSQGKGHESGIWIDDLAQGMLAGVTGKKKTSFEHVLDEHTNLPGGWQRAALGFAGDVALDPTTYVGAGLVKAPAKTLLKTTAAKAVIGDLEKAVAKNVADEALQKTVRRELERKVAGKLKKGMTLKSTKVTPKQVIDEITKRTEKEFLGSQARRSVAHVADELMLDNPGAVEFKFAGLPVYRSKGLYKAGSSVARVVGRNAEGDARLLNKVFRPEATMIDGLNDVLRKGAISNEALFADKIQALKGIFINDLNAAQREEIMFAIDEGRDLTSMAVKKSGSRFNNLEEYKQLAKKFFDDMGEEEKIMGLLGDDDLVDNYVYRMYRKDPSNQSKFIDKVVARKKSVAGPQTADFQVERKFDGTLREAQQKGLEPVTDIAESLSARYAKHYQIKATHEFFSNGIERFGVHARTPRQAKLLKQEGFKMIRPEVLKGSGAAKDMWVPEPIARAMTQMENIAGKNEVAKEFMDHLDKVMGLWKFGATSMNPGFHVRNSMTDVFLNMSDGVRSIKPYRNAKSILSARKGRVIAEEASRTGIQQEIPNALRNFGRPVKIKIGNETLTDEQVWNLFIRSGGKSGYIKAELDQFTDKLVQSTGRGRKIKGSLGRAKSHIMDFAETREDFFRLTHFIDSLEKEVKSRGISVKKNGVITQELTEAADAASKRVRKFNIDYGNKTLVERKAISRAIPFYTWMRKNLPLQIELLMTKPGFMAMYPKGQNFLQNLLGADENGNTLIPDWIKEQAPFRLRTEGKKGPLDALLGLAGIPSGQAAVMSMAATPIMDLQRLDPIFGNLAGGKMPNFGKLAGEFASESNPLIKGPFEGATGRYTFSGSPIKSAPEWLANQMPASRQAYGLMSGKEGQQNALFRWGVGVPVQGISEQMQQSEFRRRQDYMQPMTQAAMQRRLERLMKTGKV